MELKVWVEGIQRIVCGVTEATTCQDVVFALAHATGKIGRFTLIERWRSNERLLAPNENPLKILLKWGEYSSDVQFILQRSDQIKNTAANNNDATATITPPTATTIDNTNVEKTLSQPPQFTQLSTLPVTQTNATNSDIDRRNFGSSLTHQPDCSPIKIIDNIGIVRGIPQKTTSPMQSPNNSISSTATPPKPTAAVLEFNSADIRSSLDRKTSPSTNIFRDAGRNVSSESLLDATYNSLKNNNESYKNGPQISTIGALVPPPYRDPPPPRTSPLNINQKMQDSLGTGGGKRLFSENNINMSTFVSVKDLNESSETIFHNTQYRDLIQLIKYQREQISSQQADMTKFDAEIVYLENKERDQLQQIDAITREIGKTDQILRQGQEQHQTLQYIEEENELVRQQEKTLKSEITLLRSKLANCETELLQCKNKIRLIMDDIQIEQRTISRQFDTRQQMEKHFLNEVDRIQIEIEHAIHSSESSNQTMDNLKLEVAVIESAIAEKKKQVEKLVNEMKEVNLQSLAVAPSEEIRHLLEGSNRPGSTRRIIGSPRQLETAVPTSKNPHGVWV